MKHTYLLFKKDFEFSRSGTSKNAAKARANAMRFLCRSEKILRLFIEKTVRKDVKPAR
jgi:hypothetical protein